MPFKKVGRTRKEESLTSVRLQNKYRAIQELHAKENLPVILSMFTLKDGEQPLLHSDRGYQYTSHGFKRRRDGAEMIHSMSRVGKCIDNGPMESFWGTLKCEKYYLHKYQTFEALQQAIEDYIQFYNNDRYQERLNGLSPLEYRAKAA